MNFFLFKHTQRYRELTKNTINIFVEEFKQTIRKTK